MSLSQNVRTRIITCNWEYGGYVRTSNTSVNGTACIRHQCRKTAVL